MINSFNVKLAEKCGLKEALVLGVIVERVRFNYLEKVHFYKGDYWVRQSIKMFRIELPYFTDKVISRAIQSLKDQNLIMIGNFNDDVYDSTRWYALTETCLNLLRELKNDK